MTRILLVDDDDGDALVIEGRLRQSDPALTLVRARDGAEALAILRAEDVQPDLVILDLNMPGLDGHDTLLMIRATARFRNTPVVILTTSARPADVDRAYDGAANAYVQKPVGLEEFERAVDEISAFWTRTARLPGERAHA